MNLWHDVELFCRVCDRWTASGAATTAEHFMSNAAVAQREGQIMLSCGHEVSAEAGQGRLGPKIPDLGQKPSRAH